MKKFLPFSKRQPSLDRSAVSRGQWNASDRLNVKSLRRTSATSLNTRSIQVVRGAYNIDLNKVDASFTKLHRACLLNDELQVKKHIHRVDNNSHDSSKRYPIHLAVVNGNITVIKLLLENGADPNVRDNDGNTPLIKSIECGHEHLVKYLLNNGSDPNLADLDNNTALHWAIMTESIIATDALISSNKCDPLARNNRNETCLHLAVRSPLINTPTFRALIESGSDLDARDQLGLTAMEIAQACNNQIALSAFDIVRRSRESKHDNPTSKASVNQTPVNADAQADVRKLYDEYKFKYLTKNRENLDYEKKLIQLNAQIERLNLDISFVKEHYQVLERDLERLSIENTKLKSENSSLRSKLKKRHERSSLRASNDAKSDEFDTNDCRGHEEFQKIRSMMQQRIDKLKSGLST